MGFMRSTPINVLLAESGEVNMLKRRKLLAVKYLSKNYHISDNIIINQISIMNKCQNFWINKNKPAYLEAFSLLQNHKKNIYHDRQIPFYSLNYEEHVTPCTVYISDLQKSDIGVDTKFREFSENKYKGYHRIFTDASVKKSLADTSVGIGIHSPTPLYNISYKLQNYWSIYLAEMLAIGKALQYIEKRKMYKSVIFSDSLSALIKLKNWKLDSSIDIITITVKKYGPNY
ncbi:hypothetical protein WA026_002182 [Henosepilachna vigintioctopunctata]|uniref:RNase H type-1 domain-containing protein n=1 Tax=Henosepilachna vigintioctopunctata TaxID=420089 RepID=A0AAW1U374_9CUCU